MSHFFKITRQQWPKYVCLPVPALDIAYFTSATIIIAIPTCCSIGRSSPKQKLYNQTQCLVNESTLVRALIPQAGLVNEPKQWYVARGYSLDRRNKFFVSDMTNHLPETVFTKRNPHSNRQSKTQWDREFSNLLHLTHALQIGLWTYPAEFHAHLNKPLHKRIKQNISR